MQMVMMDNVTFWIQINLNYFPIMYFSFYIYKIYLWEINEFRSGCIKNTRHLTLFSFQVQLSILKVSIFFTCVPCQHLETVSVHCHFFYLTSVLVHISTFSHQASVNVKRSSASSEHCQVAWVAGFICWMKISECVNIVDISPNVFL